MIVLTRFVYRLLLLLPPLLRAIQAPSTPLLQNNSSESEELKPIDSEMKSVLVLLRPIPDADVPITGRCRSYVLNLEVSRAATSSTQAGQWIKFCFYRSYYWVTNDFSFLFFLFGVANFRKICDLEN